MAATRRHKKTQVAEYSRLTDYDIYLFREGNHSQLFEKLGGRLEVAGGEEGASFAVWAPNAESVSVIGDFNAWQTDKSPLIPRQDGSGIWEGFIGGLEAGDLYKYHIKSLYNDYSVDKGDPYAFCWESPPNTSSKLWDISYEWSDGDWMKERWRNNALEAPWSIYEVHLGSWMRKNPEEPGAPFYNYRELAPLLADYVHRTGFTHVELLPVTEHPFYGSWGYQSIGYFAPTARYGTPQDFMYLIDLLHQHGIGVILDWVPSHFPDDEHGLSYFDGTYLYEHADKKQGYHPEWKSYIFNYGRHEVRNFLLSSARFWLDYYHADGIRVDAVASMLYLDYGRKDGEWIPNEYGGRENTEAIGFLRQLNETLYKVHPDIQTIAEESTAWPMVSRPLYVGGLGFGMKWNMGWMHDTLSYCAQDPIYRKYHHNQMTFSIWYAFTENFMLPLSHDEVVYGKGSLIEKMPGDWWQRFANLRLLLGHQFCHPGKKLLFMGGEFGQWAEWYHEEGLHWQLLEYPTHEGLRRWVEDLNRTMRGEPALHELDFSGTGFEWVDASDAEDSVVSYLRRGKNTDDTVLVVANFTPIVRQNYRLGVPAWGHWKEILNSDAPLYGGSGVGNFGGCETTPVPSHGRDNSILVTLPPLGLLAFKFEG